MTTNMAGSALCILMQLPSKREKNEPFWDALETHNSGSDETIIQNVHDQLHRPHDVTHQGGAVTKKTCHTSLSVFVSH